jgi:hypothetical protein
MYALSASRSAELMELLIILQVLVKWIGCQWAKGSKLMRAVTDIETGKSKPDVVTGVAKDPQVLTTQCLEAFRRASGGAHYLAETLLPQAKEQLESEGKKLPEYESSPCDCETVCIKGLQR